LWCCIDTIWSAKPFRHRYFFKFFFSHPIRVSSLVFPRGIGFFFFSIPRPRRQYIMFSSYINHKLVIILYKLRRCLPQRACCIYIQRVWCFELRCFARLDHMIKLKLHSLREHTTFIVIRIYIYIYIDYY